MGSPWATITARMMTCLNGDYLDVLVYHGSCVWRVIRHDHETGNETCEASGATGSVIESMDAAEAAARALGGE
jgi:hypothetical protein